MMLNVEIVEIVERLRATNEGNNIHVSNPLYDKRRSISEGDGKEIENHLPENFAKYFPSLFFFSEINQQTLNDFNSHCKNYYSKTLWRVNIKNIAKIYWF